MLEWWRGVGEVEEEDGLWDLLEFNLNLKKRVRILRVGCNMKGTKILYYFLCLKKSFVILLPRCRGLFFLFFELPPLPLPFPFPQKKSLLSLFKKK